LPCDRKRKLEFNIVESINIEILIADKKWLISGVYKPQTIDEKTFNEDFIKTYNQITTAYDNFMFIGDLNYEHMQLYLPRGLCGLPSKSANCLPAIVYQ
jgi:hypothetical protein